MLVGAGQSALTSMPQLIRLLDRFTIRVQLDDADVETVTRKVLLRKKASERDEIGKTLDSYAGSVSRQLQSTRIAERPEDRAIRIDDYPLLPVRRRFWEAAFRALDRQGTQDSCARSFGFCMTPSEISPTSRLAPQCPQRCFMTLSKLAWFNLEICRVMLGSESRA